MAVSKNNVVIVGGKRTPIGHFGGYYKNVPAPILGATAIDAAIKSAGIPAEIIQEVLMGCVLSAGLGQAPARQASLLAHLPTHIPCTTINKMCGSGLKAVTIAYDAIRAEQREIMVAGGMENMSKAPYLIPGARFGYRMGAQILQDHMMHDGLIDAYEHHLSMGAIAEQCATEFHISREAQDQFARTSLERAKQADKMDFFKEEIVMFTLKNPKENMIFYQDEGLLTAKPEKIASLKPAFAKEGTVTAANASSISDGAAALCIMSESKAQTHNIKPLAWIIDYVSVAKEPHQFTTAPILAIEQLLKKINWKIEEVDLFEINEAFAVVVLVAMQQLKIPHEKVNIHGGACVLGHPIGASGARILVTLIHALRQNKKKRGIAALCIGGGEAIAIAIEA